MSNNPHFEQAEKRLRNGTINEVTRAGVEATLALAYEQRTANLIASLQVIQHEGGRGIFPTEEHAWNITKVINERLGLS